MAIGARKSTHQQRCSCATVGARHLIWTFLMGLLFFGLLASHQLLYSRIGVGPRYVRRTVYRPISNDTLLVYSQINPAVDTERDRIKLLLEETKSGKLTIRDVLYSSKTGGRVFQKRSSKTVRTINEKMSRRKVLAGRAWMLPFTSRIFDAHVPKFFQLSKMWLGDDGDFDPHVMQKLVQTVKGPLDRNSAYWSGKIPSFESLLKAGHKYESCAVVGNSGILLNGSYGEEIDSHNMVIRLNNAEIEQFKTHVGSKTTLSFINSNIFRSCSLRADCWCQNYGEEVPVIMYICQANHLMHAARCLSLQKSALLITPSLLDALCAAIVKWYSVTNFVQTTGRPVYKWDSVHNGVYFHYSSGMQAIVLALGICDRVDIYGFGKFADTKHHYHTAQKEELSLHDYAAEYLFYDDLVHNRSIPFLTEAGVPIPPVRIFF